MISVPTPTTNLQSDILNNVGVIDRWDRRKFRIVEISSSRNQCLQFCLNAFYHDIDYIKQATILWSCAHWSKLGVCMINDNVFVFNRMLCCNTAIYDEVDKKWQFDRVNDSSATCFIKFNVNHFTYLQPIAISKDKDIDKKLNNHEIVDLVEDDHFIIEESNVYSSPEILEGIYKNIIPLYSLIMSKCNSLIELVAKDKENKYPLCVLWDNVYLILQSHRTMLTLYDM